MNNTTLTDDQVRERITYLVATGSITDATPEDQVRALVEAVADAELGAARDAGAL